MGPPSIRLTRTPQGSFPGPAWAADTVQPNRQGPAQVATQTSRSVAEKESSTQAGRAETKTEEQPPMPAAADPAPALPSDIIVRDFANSDLNSPRR